MVITMAKLCMAHAWRTHGTRMAIASRLGQQWPATLTTSTTGSACKPCGPIFPLIYPLVYFFHCAMPCCEVGLISSVIQDFHFKQYKVSFVMLLLYYFVMSNNFHELADSVAKSNKIIRASNEQISSVEQVLRSRNSAKIHEAPRIL